jgi:hypothetical protein
MHRLTGAVCNSAATTAMPLDHAREPPHALAQGMGASYKGRSQVGIKR